MLRTHAAVAVPRWCTAALPQHQAQRWPCVADLATCRRHAAAAAKAAPQMPGRTKVDPKEVPAPTMKDKLKKELMTVLKINLVLIPVLVIGGLYMYPPVSATKEKEMLDLYKKSAGWKT